MSQVFASGGQSIGVSASASVLPMNTQDLSPSGWTGWISLQSKGLSRVSLLQHHSSKASIFWHSAFFTVQLSHPYMTTGKTISGHSVSTKCIPCRLQYLLYTLAAGHSACCMHSAEHNAWLIQSSKPSVYPPAGTLSPPPGAWGLRHMGGG